MRSKKILNCAWCKKLVVGKYRTRFCNDNCQAKFRKISQTIRHQYINDYEQMEIQLLRLNYEGQTYHNDEFLTPKSVCFWCGLPIIKSCRRQKFCSYDCGRIYRTMENRIYKKYCLDEVRCSQELDRLFELKEKYVMPTE